ncbi:putative RNA 2'-phosphotransferase [Seinonella peptonophila]|uniref:Probable RNA 2'-phosphotransferase n=1 Tax=Seinonella peptonophila TaxID=112248 RepID=A0A1M4WY99_9BACL|nr:RNA 2'-phosphotransferase [Seinonella peptonophila]SHE86224.1 putative RNA 2'-phosphotransferase [Seinonella peptonophila]
MNRSEQKHMSKFLTLVLRHQPEIIHIQPDPQGWVSVQELLIALQKNKKGLSVDELHQIVETNDKNRFELSTDGKRIRARYGHSISISKEHSESVNPPELLFHGTATRFLASILREGLQRMNRQYVHLSTDLHTAKQVGGRHGKPIILIIEAGRMRSDGFLFYRTEPNVWLTKHVPPAYIRFQEMSNL